MPSLKVRIGGQGRRTMAQDLPDGVGADDGSMRKEVQAQKVHSQRKGVAGPRPSPSLTPCGSPGSFFAGVHSCALASDGG